MGVDFGFQNWGHNHPGSNFTLQVKGAACQNISSLDAVEEYVTFQQKHQLDLCGYYPMDHLYQGSMVTPILEQSDIKNHNTNGCK